LTTALAGARAIAPLAAAVFPFGLVYGVTVAESSFSDLAGAIASLLVFAGAAQLAMVNLLEEGSHWVVAVVTGLVINLRMMMYSGALAPSFSQYPKRWRIPMAHFITDQQTVVSLLYNDRERDPDKRRYFYLGAAALFFGAWVAGTVAGVLVGATIPPELQLGFAVPLMFLALLVPSVKDRPSLVAAAVGFAVTLLAQDAPLNTGLLIGAGVGIGFGLLASRLRGSHPAGATTVDGREAGEAGPDD
jgi:4-azaleucine resistance transporter AzlC